MENECPCIECLCIPICKPKTTIEVVRRCSLFNKFANDVMAQIPRDSYRVLQVYGLERTYEITKKINGECTWRDMRRYTSQLFLNKKK